MCSAMPPPQKSAAPQCDITMNGRHACAGLTSHQHSNAGTALRQAKAVRSGRTWRRHNLAAALAGVYRQMHTQQHVRAQCRLQQELTRVQHVREVVAGAGPAAFVHQHANQAVGHVWLREGRPLLRQGRALLAKGSLPLGKGRCRLGFWAVGAQEGG